mmetsp:Transcript_12574/g.53876  ORF Transcript_12574/g.53876 Transcript_12574/m.53876 type:complete len:226 (-) Transcript_12574:905-1582(-)
MPRRRKQSLGGGAAHVVVLVVERRRRRGQRRREQARRERVPRGQHVPQSEQSAVPHLPLRPPEQHQDASDDRLDSLRRERQQTRAQRLRAGFAHGRDDAVAHVIPESVERQNAEQAHGGILEPGGVFARSLRRGVRLDAARARGGPRHSRRGGVRAEHLAQRGGGAVPLLPARREERVREFLAGPRQRPPSSLDLSSLILLFRRLSGESSGGLGVDRISARAALR